MTTRRWVISGMLVLGLGAVFSSCIDYEEELVLNADGTGTFRQILKLEKNYLRNLRKTGKLPLTRESVEESLPPGITLVEFVDKPLGKRNQIISSTLRFDDFHHVLRLAREGRAAFFGEIEWKRDYLGRIHYRRLLKKKGENLLGEGPYRDMINMGVGKGAFTPYSFKFHMKTPYQVIRSNAVSVRDRELTWIVPLTKMIEQKEEIVLAAYLEKPYNLFLVLAIYGGIFFGLVFFIFLWIRKKRY